MTEPALENQRRRPPKPFRVVLTGPIHDAGRACLEPIAELATVPSGREADLVDAITDADGLIVRANGEITRRVLANGRSLKVVGRHGVGVDNIDCAAAAELGIVVVHTPYANDRSVAEQTLAFLLHLAKRLDESDAAVRSGNWAFRERLPGRELYDRTLGIVGLGRVGLRVARLARALGMCVLYADPRRDLGAEHDLGLIATSLDDLLVDSDAVSLHVPLVAGTHHLIDQRALALMKADAYLINTSRGGLVDEAALLDALRNDRLGAVALDVFEQEPLPRDHPLLGHPRVLTSPHSAAMTDAAARRMSLVAEDVRRVLVGEAPLHPVSVPDRGDERVAR